MGTQENQTTSDLLNVDIDSIVKSGIRSSKQRKKKIYIISTLLVIILLLLIYPVYRIYKGVSLCNSEVYTSLKDETERNLSSASDNVSFEYNFIKDAIVISNSIPNITVSSFDSITPEFFASWGTLCESVNTSTSIYQETLSNSGYAVDVVATLYDETNSQELFISENGVTSYNYLDMENVKSKMYETLYTNIVSFVEAEEYTEANDYWERESGPEYYTDEYKDLNDYVYYAKGMAEYIEGQEISLADILENLEMVSPNFKDTSTVIRTISDLRSSLNGTYSSESYTLTISNESADFQYKKPESDYYNSILNSLYEFQNFTATLDKQVIEEGVLKEVHGTGYLISVGADDITISPTANGVVVSYGGDWVDANGTYERIS